VTAKYAKQFRWTDLSSGEYDLLHAQDALDDVEAQRVVKALIVP
jgi:L-iditol 2-dehydrogenase